MKNLIAYTTIVRKEVLRILRIWPQTLLPSVITTTLYFVIFGNLIGSRIGEMDGINYISFIVPGLIMMSVIINSYSNVSSSFFSNKMMKNIEELLVSPMPGWVLILGYISGGVFRGLAIGILVTLVSLFFTHLQMHNIFIIISTVLLTSLMFSLGGMLNSIFAKNFDDIAIVPNFVLTPLTYFAGVFYSISLLPPIWQKISLINPILYMVNAFRYGFLGISDVNIYFAFFILILFNIILFIVNLYFINTSKGLRN